jgi:hypothetical protein
VFAQWCYEEFVPESSSKTSNPAATFRRHRQITSRSLSSRGSHSRLPKGLSEKFRP